MKAIRVSATLAVLLSAAACGGEGRQHGSDGGDAARSAPPPAVSYSGPAIPGLETKPMWSLPNFTAGSAVGLGRTFAVVRDQPGHNVILLDAATGKTVSTGRPLSEPTDDLSKPGPPQLIKDTHRGTPVVVVRYKEHVPASGMQAEHDQDSDLVLDETGREVWQTPKTTDGAHYFVSGYAVDGHLSMGGGFVQSTGPYEGLPTDVRTVTPVDGGKSVDVAGGELMTSRFVYAVRGTTAVATHPGELSANGVEGLNLTNGKRAWTMKGVTYLGMFGDSVLTSLGDYKTESQELTFLDAATGRKIGSSRTRQFDCHVSAFDKDSGSALCASLRLGRSPLTVLDSSTAKIRWQQPGTNARDLQPMAAAGGVAYLVVNESESDTGRRHDYVAVNDRTGQVLADNIGIDSITLADSGTALVSYQGTLYGFRTKKIA